MAIWLFVFPVVRIARTSNSRGVDREYHVPWLPFLRWSATRQPLRLHPLRNTATAPSKEAATVSKLPGNIGKAPGDKEPKHGAVAGTTDLGPSTKD